MPKMIIPMTLLAFGIVIAACDDVSEPPKCPATTPSEVFNDAYLGKSIDAINKIPENTRIIRPGDAVTKDLRRDRLNLILDENDVVVNIGCY